MDYFCYISRSKVDQLYQTLNPEGVDEWTEHESTEHDVNSNVNADLTVARIFSLFKGGLSYGRKGVIQRERKVKLEYVEKLRKVLIEISRTRAIPALHDVLHNAQTDSIYCHHSGSFRVPDAEQSPADHNSDSIVTIQTECDGVALSLDCSLRYFSEGTEPDGRFAFNSSNARFFKGKIPLQMECVFIILHRSSAEIVGTPLYLKLGEDSPAYL